MSKIWTTEECLEYLREAADGDFLVADDIRGSGGPSIRTLQRRFGSWNNAKRLAGLETIPNHKPENGIDGSEYFNKILDLSSCVNCGESDNACIEFHHVRGDKSFNISSANQPGSTWSSSTVYKELQKCLPLCSNCHSRHHSERSEFKCRNIPGYEWPRPEEVADNRSDDIVPDEGQIELTNYTAQGRPERSESTPYTVKELEDKRFTMHEYGSE